MAESRSTWDKLAARLEACGSGAVKLTDKEKKEKKDDFMRSVFRDLVPEDTRHVTVTLAPAASFPVAWVALVGLGAGVVAVTLTVLRRRRT